MHVRLAVERVEFDTRRERTHLQYLSWTNFGDSNRSEDYVSAGEFRKKINFLSGA